jgi:hypothetical protein
MVQTPGPKASLESIFTGQFKDRVFFLSLALIVALWTVVCVISRDPGRYAVLQFFTLSALMLLITLALLYFYHHHQRRLPFSLILLSAIALRLISLTGDPLFEDDYYRYMWDGYQTATIGNPYLLPPSHFFDENVPDQFESILSLINYPDVATVYGPFSQWIFALAYHIDAAAVWPLQLLAGIADILVLCALYALGASNACLLYAWSPLLLKEFSLTAHPDSYAIAGMVLGILALHRNHLISCGIALALAFSAKVFAVLVIPFLLTATLSLRASIKITVAFAATLVGITAWYGDLIIWFPEGLQAMARDWLFNAPLYLLLLHGLSFQAVKLLLLALFCMAALMMLVPRAWVWWSGDRPATTDPAWVNTQAGFRGDRLFIMFLFCLPVANPWYLAWALPFAVLYRSTWVWIASVAVLLSYHYGVYVGAPGSGYQQSSILIMSIEYGLILAGWAISIAQVWCCKTSASQR